jgi:hypothetical protein
MVILPPSSSAPSSRSSLLSLPFGIVRTVMVPRLPTADGLLLARVEINDYEDEATGKPTMFIIE